MATPVKAAKAAFIVRILIESLQHRQTRRLLEAGFTGSKKDKLGRTRYYQDGRQVKNPNAPEKGPGSGSRITTAQNANPPAKSDTDEVLNSIKQERTLWVFKASRGENIPQEIRKNHPDIGIYADAILEDKNKISEKYEPLATGKIFQNKEMALPKKNTSRFDTLEDLYAEAEKTKPEFFKFTNEGEGLEKRMGAKTVHVASQKDFVNGLAEMMQNKGPFIILATGLKSRQRALEKLDADNTSPNNLTDIIRATVVVDNLSDIPHALQSVREELQERGWKLYQKPKNNMYQGNDAAYRDINLVLESPSGMPCELQINTKRMVYAKEIGEEGVSGHSLYEKARALDEKLQKGAILSKDEMLAWRHAHLQMRQIYQQAHQKQRESEADHELARRIPNPDGTG